MEKMIRTYARVVGILLLLIGLSGWAGLINASPATNFYHVAVGAFFAYLGFLQRDTKLVREVVGGMGVLLVFIMGAAVVVLLLSGENPLIEVIYLALGILSILAAKYLPSSAARTWGFRRVKEELRQVRTKRGG